MADLQTSEDSHVAIVDGTSSKDQNDVPVTEADSTPPQHHESENQADEMKPAEAREDIYSPFPRLVHDHSSELDGTAAQSKVIQNEDDEDDLPKSMHTQQDADKGIYQRNPNATATKVGEEGIMKMHRFVLYETQNFYYILGSDMLKTSYRILKIDRTADIGELNVIDDDIVYTARETKQILNAIDEGNRATGGMKIKGHEFWGLLGFIKFTGPYYMVYISGRSHVAVLGGHYINRIEATEMLQLTTSITAKIRPEHAIEEARLLAIFNTIDLSKGFYFSSSYDISRTLQHNIKHERQTLLNGERIPPHNHNDMFVWNHHLLEPAKVALRNPYDWCLPITHGYIDQCEISVYWGISVYIAIIARRSRFFAGARYLKRGANDLGYVANDVETEQIVCLSRNTSFHAPGPTLFASPDYTSHVQHRGSIPLYWTQDINGVSPKPDIHLNVVDPFFSAAALHFDNLFQRYGAPIYVLNLIKARERQPRESKLLHEYTQAVGYLNQFLPADRKIHYHTYDMSRASKSKDQDVIGTLEILADEAVNLTGFFQNGADAEHNLRVQRGIIRTNCIDCLDRTNAAQFVIAKKALAMQLSALGIIERPELEYDTDITNIFTDMWHDHGDTIALQYGGSHLVNTMSTYRRTNQWASHSRDMVESFKRFVNNSFLDTQRQEAYNLFLGSYIYDRGQPLLWEMSSDYFLHHTNPRSMFGRQRPKYRHWYTDEYLVDEDFPSAVWPAESADKRLDWFDDYWAEYYRPLTLSSFQKMFAYKIRSNLASAPAHQTQTGRYDLSPFKVRMIHEEEAEKNKSLPSRKKGVKVIAPSEEKPPVSRTSSVGTRLTPTADNMPKPQALGNWLNVHQQIHGAHKKYTGIIKDSSWERASRTPTVPELPTADSRLGDGNEEPTKQELAVQSFAKMVANSLDPQVPETEEYEHYVTHPSNIALVTTTDTEFDKTPHEFLDYFSRTDEIDASFRDKIDFSGDNKGSGLTVDERAELSLEDYLEHMRRGEADDALTVAEDDTTSKRYKTYKQWLRGKSLFKQKFQVAGENA